MLGGFLGAFVSKIFSFYSSLQTVIENLSIAVNLFRDCSLNLVIGALVIKQNSKLREGQSAQSLSMLSFTHLRDFTAELVMDFISNLILNRHKADVMYK